MTRTILQTLVAALSAVLVCGFTPAQGDGGLKGKALDLALLNRLTWGVDAASVAELQRLGPDKWLERQLHPLASDRLPPAAQAQIDAMAISQSSMAQLVMQMEAQNQAANRLADPTEKQAAQKAYQDAFNDLGRQAATRSLLRDLYSPDQLQEQMTWFWMNHFNVHMYKANIRAMIGDYEAEAVRPHALGRFRDLIAATLRHPAMLRYLDNAENAAGHINENYARELMELHTLGVDAGYTQKDVQELARILTGVGVDPNPKDPNVPPDRKGELVRSGLFEFNPARHDYGDKVLLGHLIKGRGLAEVDQALDVLCREPATARHISHDLAVYFVSDAPPPDLIAAMAQTFQRTDGDIAQVIRTMVRSKHFRASLGRRFKDPIHYAISAVRLAYGEDRPILNANPIQGWLGRLAEQPFNHETPDGYALTSPGWTGPGQMAMRFEIARQIGSGSAGLFKPPVPDAQDEPAFPQLQNALYYNIIADTLKPITSAALAKAVSPQDWNTLFLASPDFMYR